MNWDDFKIAHAVARHGSLSAAARALGSTQPTVSRRISALERRLDLQLFEREAGGLRPGPLLNILLEHLDDMDDLARAVERRIAARGDGLQGAIVLTSLPWFGDDVLAPLLARFCVRYPGVSIDMVNDARRFNLARGEADIAVRVGSFDEEGIIERRLADVSYGLYASSTYFRRYGRPDFSRRGAGHFLVSLAKSPVEVPHVQWLNSLLPEAATVLRSNGLQSHIQTVAAGEAMSVLPRFMGDRRPGLIHVRPPVAEPAQPIKIGVHPDVRDTPRIRALIDFLAQELRLKADQLQPSAA